MNKKLKEALIVFITLILILGVSIHLKYKFTKEKEVKVAELKADNQRESNEIQGKLLREEEEKEVKIAKNRDEINNNIDTINVLLDEI